MYTVIVSLRQSVISLGAYVRHRHEGHPSTLEDAAIAIDWHQNHESSTRPSRDQR